MKKLILNFRIQKLGICMRNNICLGLGATLAFAVSAYAQNYKINKVGNDEEKSFNVLFEQNLVEEAAAGSWLSVIPNTPEGKVFKGFTVYDEYGDSREQRKTSTTEKNDSQFVMPDHDVYVTASFESLRYYLTVKNTDNGSVSLSFNDRYRDRTKPGVKVTVNPNASNGYKVASISVVRALDANTVVPCAKVESVFAVEGSCAFDMPNFDVEVSAVFVSNSVDLSSSSSNVELSSSSAEIASNSSSSSDVVVSSSSELLASSSSAEVASSSSEVQSSSSAEIASNSSSSRNDDVSSSSVDVASSSSEVQSSSSAEIASNSSSSRNDEISSSSEAPVSSSNEEIASSSSVSPASSSSVKSESSSSAKPASSSSAKQASSSSAKPASSSSAKPASSSSSAIQDIIVEAVGTEEDMPSCTVKRENMTFYVTELKTVFVCKSRVWTKFNPGMKIANIRATAKFSAIVNGRSLQISGAKIGTDVNLLDMQGRVIYSSRANTENFSMNVPRSGSYVLRIGAQQRIVNVR